jgi:hypothetical protein
MVSGSHSILEKLGKDARLSRPIIEHKRHVTGQMFFADTDVAVVQSWTRTGTDEVEAIELSAVRTRAAKAGLARGVRPAGSYQSTGGLPAKQNPAG